MAEITITRLGLRGDGVAEGPVFAARTLPGEVVTGDIVDGRIAAPKIVSPSADRVRAACPHYKTCGGCQLMHATDAFVETWKRDVVIEALAAQGIKAGVTGVATSQENSRRRAKFTGRRLKSGPVVGFHAMRSDAVTPIPDCRVLAPELIACLPAMEDITDLAGSRRGSLFFALTATDTGVDCAVAGGPELDSRLVQELPRFRNAFVRLTWNTELVFADPLPRLKLGQAELTPPPGAFLQATQAGQDALTEVVNRATTGATAIADLFAGCGTFSLPLASFAPVHAVEGDADLLAALDHAARNTQGLKPITTEARDLFRRPLDVEELRPFDAVVIDPPRAGAAAQTAMLAKARIPRVAMISCNPVTFARDAKQMVAAGYRIGDIRVVDQFRWSTHIEIAAELVLA